MSLAFYASPFENESTNNENKNDSPIARKRNTNNRTQKRTGYNSEKVNSMIASIHNSSINDNDEMGDFNPPAPPQSMGVQNTIIKEGTTTNISSQTNQGTPLFPPHQSQMFTDDGDLNNINGSIQTSEEYYRKMIPNYGETNNNMVNNHVANKNVYNRQYYQPTLSDQTLTSNGDNIMEKLNYMINLLEENHDERTENVTEEVVLYSFLGVFIIFIADSFARVGKYTR
jgi:hypothetical protein